MDDVRASGLEAGPAADVVVVGGGVVGLTTAWRLSAQGARVVVVDSSGSRGASWTAAGMLAPVCEAAFGEQDLLRLLLHAARGVRAATRELETETGLQVGLRDGGTLLLAVSPGDRAALARTGAFRHDLGLVTTALADADLRCAEPLLAGGARGALLAPDDGSVDGRRLVLALLTALAARDVLVLSARVEQIATSGGRVVGVRTRSHLVRAATVVLAAGAWTARLAGVPSEVARAVHPVKGQLLRLSVPEALRICDGNVLHRTVRALVHGREVYLVPRTDGELVVGATSEDAGWDEAVTAGAVLQLLQDAEQVLPIVSELELVEARAGLRPGTPDNGPLLGWTSVTGLLAATGHHRNGVLLSVATAEAVVDLLAGRPADPVWDAFGPGRFA